MKRLGALGDKQDDEDDDGDDEENDQVELHVLPPPAQWVNQTSNITRHTSHATRHTSHVTKQFVARHTSPTQIRAPP